MREHPLPRPRQHSILSLSRASSDVRSNQLGDSRVAQRLSPHSVLRHSQGFRHAPQDDLSPRVGCSAHILLDRSTDNFSIFRFPEWNIVPDFPTFSSLLRITAKYEMPAIRSRTLEVVRDAYPETFEGLSPSKPLGEGVFSGRTPHPNEVLNLFVQQGFTSALPMAYYMATRRGPDSLIGSHLPRNAILSTEVLRSAIRGLVALHRAELNETHRLIFGPKGSHPCSTSDCPSRTPASTTALEAYQKVFDHIVGSSQLGTKVLEVPNFHQDCGDCLQCVGPNICVNCVERWETGHTELRKRVWATLPAAFGLVSGRAV